MRFDLDLSDDLRVSDWLHFWEHASYFVAHLLLNFLVSVEGNIRLLQSALHFGARALHSLQGLVNFLGYRVVLFKQIPPFFCRAKFGGRRIAPLKSLGLWGHGQRGSLVAVELVSFGLDSDAFGTEVSLPFARRVALHIG